jgi:glycosyltransferase involved in cell wall biosynthesis
MSDRAEPIVTVVVMAYNEAAALEPTVREIAATLGDMDGAHDIVVVDDGSTDDTPAVADRLEGSVPRLRVIHHLTNAGLGGVYRSGFAAARSELLTFFPADGQFPATIIPEFRAAIVDADFVLGFVPDRRSPWFARFMSGAERALYGVLVGRLPLFQGIFMCRTAALRDLPLRSAGRGWAVVMELFLRADRKGYRLVNRPTTMRPRMAGRSKVHNVRTIASNTRQMLALRRLL